MSGCKETDHLKRSNCHLESRLDAAYRAMNDMEMTHKDTVSAKDIEIAELVGASRKGSKQRSRDWAAFLTEENVAPGSTKRKRLDDVTEEDLVWAKEQRRKSAR